MTTLSNAIGILMQRSLSSFLHFLTGVCAIIGGVFTGNMMSVAHYISIIPWQWLA